MVVTTAFELIGVGLLALLAGSSNDMGNIIIILMAGFVLGWLLVNSTTLSRWVKNV